MDKVKKLRKIAEDCAYAKMPEQSITKGSFEKVAAFLKNQPGGTITKEALVNFLVNWFSESNPRFDKDRFLKAAGYMV